MPRNTAIFRENQQEKTHSVNLSHKYWHRDKWMFMTMTLAMARVRNNRWSYTLYDAEKWQEEHVGWKIPEDVKRNGVCNTIEELQAVFDRCWFK